MPLYDYQCKECGEVFELMVRFSESNQTHVCPKCESKNTQRKLSVVASFTVSSSGASNSASSCNSSGGYT
ncbi:MAG: zinc ribbon domain-containing protein [Chloroflexi bacterium]|nr:zinc ribbon domain-containing protein [Chloroflexota bacterium]